MIGEKIKVLIVDDSLVYREVISMGISSEPNIEVAAKAADAFDAVEKIIRVHPDVMICDVEMPKMNGLEFIRELLPKYPIPVIVISSMSRYVVDVMEAGAVDFIIKPNIQSSNSVKVFIVDLIKKINLCSSVNVIQSVTKNKRLIDTNNKFIDKTKIVAIGASTGGTEAIYSILKEFPACMPGIVIVQHIPPVFSKMFSERLNSQTSLKVKEAESGDYIEPGCVLVAPGDKHMKVKRVGNRYKVELFEGKKVNGHCPSVDVLFNSMADEVGKNGIGIILTGMGADGAKGLSSMRKIGARTIGQDKKTSVVYGMPKVAYEMGAVEKQVSLEAIPQVLLEMLKKSS